MLVRLAGGPEKLAVIVESVLGAVHNDSSSFQQTMTPFYVETSLLSQNLAQFPLQ
jgi:hypothetical protein